MPDSETEPAGARRQASVIGVVLAGGRGQRIGGAKALVELGGKPLISHAVEAMTAAVDDVAVLAKADTELPSLPGTTVWLEPQSHHHPLVGIRQALALADGRPVLVCAADLPFVTVKLLRRLAAGWPGAPALIASALGRPQPLLGRYENAALRLLPNSEAAGDRPLARLVDAIGPRLLEVDDPVALFNVNAPDDLRQATEILARRGSSSSAVSSTERRPH